MTLNVAAHSSESNGYSGSGLGDVDEVVLPVRLGNELLELLASRTFLDRGVKDLLLSRGS